MTNYSWIRFNGHNRRGHFRSCFASIAMLCIGCSSEHAEVPPVYYDDAFSETERAILCKEDAKLKRDGSAPRVRRKATADGSSSNEISLVAVNGYTTWWHIISKPPLVEENHIARTDPDAAPVTMNTVPGNAEGLSLVAIRAFAYVDAPTSTERRASGSIGLYPVKGDSYVAQIPQEQVRWYERLKYRRTSHGLAWGLENAIDIAAPLGAKVQAFRAGVVVWTEDRYGDYGCGKTDYPSIGNSIYVLHDDGTEARYEHVKRGSITVAVGQRVAEGQVIAQVGFSGAIRDVPHLHLQTGAMTDEGLVSFPLRFYTDRSQSAWAPRYRQRLQVEMVHQ